MKLISISIASWLLGLSAILLTFFAFDTNSLTGGGVNGVTFSSLMTAALIFSLAYGPAMVWLRRRLGGCRPALAFPLASALVINLPVYLIGFFAIGRTLPATQALASIGAFVLMGSAFGFGFVWNYHDRNV